MVERTNGQVTRLAVFSGALEDPDFGAGRIASENFFRLSYV
jgi:hypothetical protein